MAENLVALLAAEDVEQFNSVRGERGRPDLFAADLAEKKLPKVDLSNANLEKADLTGTDLTDANLMKANLSGIDGSGMVIRDALALRSRFKGAWLDGAELSGTDFTQADMADAVLEGAFGDYVRMVGTRLRGVNAKGAKFPDADLSEAKLHQAIFAGADLRRADLSEASGAEADFSGAIMDGVVAASAKFNTANFEGASLGSARLSGIQLAGANLKGADLVAADLSFANLTGADLTGADLTGALLVDACLDEAILEGTMLEGADLTGLDVSGLGLDEHVIAGLSGHGVAHDPDAPLIVTEYTMARVGESVAVAWANEDDEDTIAWRVAILKKGGKRVISVLPVPAASILAATLIAFEDGFRLIATRDRPSGPEIAVWPLSTEGVLGAALSAPVGYEPAVKPVIQVMNGAVHLMGLARRGPTLVVHRLGEEGFEVVRSDKVATARGFLGGELALACKGGVVMPISASGPGGPRRSPDGFPGTSGTAAPVDGTILAVWGLPPKLRDPGSVQVAELGKRGAPVGTMIAPTAPVGPIASWSDGSTFQVAWCEDGSDGFKIITAELPGPRVFDVATAPVVQGLAVADGMVAWKQGAKFVAVDPAAKWSVTLSSEDGVTSKKQ